MKEYRGKDSEMMVKYAEDIPSLRKGEWIKQEIIENGIHSTIGDHREWNTFNNRIRLAVLLVAAELEPHRRTRLCAADVRKPS